MRFGDDRLDPCRTSAAAHRSDDDDVAVRRDFQWRVGADTGSIQQRLVEHESEAVACTHQLLDHAALRTYSVPSRYGRRQGSHRRMRPATARTLRGAASQMATIDT